MATLFVKHRVVDYGAWRQVYDGFRPTQTKLGVQAQAVYRGADDPNEITVTHDFATLDSARTFADSPELHAAMASAGVDGAPTIWFTNPV